MRIGLFHATPPRIMGILNCTPDSFSDGGRYLAHEAALAHAVAMCLEGADVIDVGGESTRPGAEPVPAAVQEQRVVPVLRQLRERIPARVALSIDTTSAQVAAAALAAGADWINDTSAGSDDPDMLPLVAAHGVPIVLMHRQGQPRDMQVNPQYDDVVSEVCAHLTARVTAAVAAGVDPRQIALDPGLGFGKRFEHNWALLAGLSELVALGFPVILGASRKRFLTTPGVATAPANQVAATCATTALGVAAGVAMLRVHDVAANRHAAAVAWAVRQSQITTARPELPPRQQ